MNTALTTEPKTYFHLGALVILVVTAMGAGSLTWWQAGAAAAVLVVVPWIVARIVKLLRKPEPGPKDGGNVIFCPGRPGPGGLPGCIIPAGLKFHSQWSIRNAARGKTCRYRKLH